MGSLNVPAHRERAEYDSVGQAHKVGEMKPRMKLRLVESRPAASMDEKRARAIAYLRERRLYVLDRGTPARWGIPQPGKVSK